ncbi:hypothetical protein EDD53_1028 [Pacificibacter maritimus]|uniref:Uncharacterized protein n=1 Tax=Pacificibacter maritimus TaxID=762213 RepID=A0A3N4UT67_9RHOB|nr:hypothetical protein [Pacificibacter maritimus]RPE71895.1 hypothetical protein EDD53_1028 [Pacificibacter maritimus]
MTSDETVETQAGRQAAELAYWAKYADQSPAALTETALQMYENLTLAELAEMALLPRQESAA